MYGCRYSLCAASNTRHAKKLSRKFEALRCKYFCSGELVIITYSELLSVSLDIRHAKIVRNIFLSVSRPAPQYYSSLFNIRHDFRKKKSLNIKCVFWFSVQFWFIKFHNSKNTFVYVGLRMFSCKVKFFLPNFNTTRIFSTFDRKIIQYQLLWKSFSW